MSYKNIFHVGEKEKQDKNNLQLKFYTWLETEPRLAQALRSTVLCLLHWATGVRAEAPLIQSNKNYYEE